MERTINGVTVTIPDEQRTAMQVIDFFCKLANLDDSEPEHEPESVGSADD